MSFSQRKRAKRPKYKGWPSEVPGPSGPQGDGLQWEGKQRHTLRGSSL